MPNPTVTTRTSAPDGDRPVIPLKDWEWVTCVWCGYSLQRVLPRTVMAAPRASSRSCGEIKCRNCHKLTYVDRYV